MKVSDGIKIAYDRKWSMANTFEVYFIMRPELEKAVGGRLDELVNINIVNIQTPDFTNDPIESFIANRWVIHNGKDALYRFSITFRDYDQMFLYRKFMKIYNFAKDNYFDSASMNVLVTKDADWFHEKDKMFMFFSGCLVEGVSNLDFSNETENQVAQFTVNFKCTTPNVY